jgi:hypothetical protein
MTSPEPDESFAPEAGLEPLIPEKRDESPVAKITEPVARMAEPVVGWAKAIALGIGDTAMQWKTGGTASTTRRRTGGDEGAVSHWPLAVSRRRTEPHRNEEQRVSGSRMFSAPLSQSISKGPHPFVPSFLCGQPTLG